MRFLNMGLGSLAKNKQQLGVLICKFHSRNRNSFNYSTSKCFYYFSCIKGADVIQMTKIKDKVGFVAGGNMAFAIGSGLIKRGVVNPQQVLVSGPHLDRMERWRDIGVPTIVDNCEVVKKSDIIFICIKPQVLESCMTQLRNEYSPMPDDKDKLFISVLAGVNLFRLEEEFSFIEGLKIIRTMPNSPIQIGEGCIIYTPGKFVTENDVKKADMIFNSLGYAQQVPEELIDPITAISGCGPAYIYTIIDAMADGGVKVGIPKDLALMFAAQTIMGSVKTIMLTGKHPAALKDEVCSPGGSTIAASHELEMGAIKGTIMKAIEKARDVSQQLGKTQKKTSK